MLDDHAKFLGPAAISQAFRFLADSRDTGFEALVALAEILEAACLEGDAACARERLLDLTTIAQRIRLGHKGAV